LQARLYCIVMLQREYSFAFALLLLISTIVIADPTSQLDLPDEFNNLNVDDIFSRGEEWREPESKENEWRKPKQGTTKREVRWGAKSIYEDNDEIDPFSPSPRKSGEIIRSPEPAHQFQLRF